jgi:hypothetical protein
MSELVVGTKRATTVKPWRSGLIALAIVIIALVVAWFIVRRAVTYDMPDVAVVGGLHNVQRDGDASEVRFGDSSLSFRGGIKVLRAVGEPHQIGAAHGRLLGDDIAQFNAATAPSIRALPNAGGWFDNVFTNLAQDWRLRFLDDGLSDSDRRMLAGMIRGAQASGGKADYRSLVHASAAIDIGEPSPRTAESDVHIVARTLSMITPLATDPTRLWLATIASLPGLDDGGESLTPLVSINKPAGKQIYACVGWPGLAGAVIGVNESSQANGNACATRTRERNID